LTVNSATGGFPLRLNIVPATCLHGHRLCFGPPKKIDGFRVVKLETAAPPFGRLAVTMGQHFVSVARRFEAEVLAMTVVD